MSDGVRYNDRALALGMTQSGKSEFLNHVMTATRVQRVLVDSKHDLTVAEVEPVSDVGAIDWKAPIVHYQDTTGDAEEFDELFDVCLRRAGKRDVYVHELADICEHNPGRTGRGVRGYIVKGQGLGKGLKAASQRPRGIPTVAYTEATHFFVFAYGGLSARDLPLVAQEIGIPAEQLQAELDDVRRQYGDYGFIWLNKRDRTNVLHCEPLAEHVRAHNIAQRRPLA